MSEADLNRWHREHDRLRRAGPGSQLFPQTPTKPVTVLLFSGEASYDRYARKLFNEAGVSVYGYYKPDRRTLVMNIATGGGTLIHELTHAADRFRFPRRARLVQRGPGVTARAVSFQARRCGPRRPAELATSRASEGDHRRGTRHSGSRNAGATTFAARTLGETTRRPATFVSTCKRRAAGALLSQAKGGACRGPAGRSGGSRCSSR